MTERIVLKRDVQETAARRFEDERSFVWKDGRETLRGLDWDARKKELWDRCGGRCEWTYMVGKHKTRCMSRAMDPHHLVKRSEKRDDRLDNLQALCRVHHYLQDNRRIVSDKRRADAL